MDEYLETYSLDDLLTALAAVYTRCKSVMYADPCNLTCILEILKDKAPCEYLLAYEYGTKSNFYQENDDAEPYYHTTKTSGTFFDESNPRVYTDTATNTYTPYHYGKYAIEKYSGYRYYEGKYGWYDGVFVNEPSRFIPETHYNLYCQGEYIWRMDSEMTFFEADTYIGSRDAPSFRIDHPLPRSRRELEHLRFGAVRREGLFLCRQSSIKRSNGEAILGRKT